MASIGTVGELRRYPVKSMLGETLAHADVRTRGLSGDRVCALIDDETGRVASAKMPRRWSRLLACAAAFRDDSGAVEIVTPDGRRLDPADPGAAAKISEFVEPSRDVRVRPRRGSGARARQSRRSGGRAATKKVRARRSSTIGMGAPEGGFFDAFPIHFVTTASLDRVAEVSLAKAAEPARFRPNIVIDSVGLDAFAENGWEGALLSIGPELRLRVAFPTPRCAVPTLAHGAIPADPRLTVEIGKLNRAPVLDMGPVPCLGAYARSSARAGSRWATTCASPRARRNEVAWSCPSPAASRRARPALARRKTGVLPAPRGGRGKTRDPKS